MNSIDGKSLSTVPKWDGAQDTCARYIAQVMALSEYYDCGDAMDSVAMGNCPTKTEYEVIGANPSGNDLKRSLLWRQNKRMCAILTLGQASDHGLAVIQKTVTADFPQGKAYRVIEMLMAKNKPKDVSAEIELDAELEKVQFRNANDYYNDVVAVMARFDVVKSDTDLIKIMAKKVNSSVYANEILKHLGDASQADDLETMCEEISKIQRLTKANGGNSRGKDKEVQLTSAEGGKGDFKGICGHCKKRCGYKRKDCPLQKASGNGGNSNNGGGNGDKTCSHCGRKGHLESGCWKKHPEKAPQWWKDLQAKGEAAGGSVEIMVASVEADFAQAHL